MHWNKTVVNKRHSDSTVLAPEVLFDDTQVTLVEQAQPARSTCSRASGTRTSGSSRCARTTSVRCRAKASPRACAKTWGGKWLTDVAVGYNFSDNLRLTIGANNVFDVYPDKWDAGITNPERPAVRRLAADQRLSPRWGFIYGWETMPSA
jgi:iron complex outermembrane receptor protein